MSKPTTHRPLLTVIAGPTAVGKGTVVAKLREIYPEVFVSISATTRSPRPGEEPGVAYHFVSDSEFDELVASGQMLEWATVHGGCRYGTPRGTIAEKLAAGVPVLLEIDLAGARQVRKAMPEACMVFLSPPSWEELVSRLVGRSTETPEDQERRLETAKIELAAKSEFDEIVTNDEVERAARELARIMGLK